MRAPTKLCRNKLHPMTVRNTKITPEGVRCRGCIRENRERLKRRRHPELHAARPFMCQVPRGNYAVILAEATAEFRLWDSAHSRAERKEQHAKLGIKRSVATRAAKKAA